VSWSSTVAGDGDVMAEARIGSKPYVSTSEFPGTVGVANVIKSDY